jgi:hypothetical protein
MLCECTSTGVPNLITSSLTSQILHQVKIFVDSTQDLQAVAKAQESMLTKEAERETESEAIRSQLRSK